MKEMSNYTQRQYITRAELMEAGYTHYKIKQLEEKGDLISINRKYYENLRYEGELNDFYAVPAYSGQGIVCLMSAAVYYELTTHRLFQIDVAIPRGMRTPHAPEWPAMQFYRFSDTRYETGICSIMENENKFLIYDMEKTVCDIVFYRNKLGFESAVEILRNYLTRKERDINKLMKYAEKLHVKKILSQYLEVML